MSYTINGKLNLRLPPNISGAFFVVLLFIGFISWPAISISIAPAADLAADMLLANRISDEGYLLVGHYSRWQFNHPGPFWFYYNHLAEFLFQHFVSSRYQAWYLGSILINSIFITFSSVSLSKFFLDKVDFKYCIVFTILFIGFVGGEVAGLWMPNRLITPYLAFLACILHILSGGFRYISYAAFLCCILIHGYATMPFFTLPLLAAALILGWLREKDVKSIKAYRKSFFVSFSIALVFVTPILIDLLLNKPSNLYNLLSANSSFEGMPKPSWSEMSIFAIDLMIKNRPISWVFAIMTVMVAASMSRKLPRKTRREISTTYILLLTVFAVTLLYYKNTPSPIYSFVAQYLVVLPPLLFLTALTPAFISANSFYGRNNIIFTRELFFIVSVIFALTFQARPVPPPDPGSVVMEYAERISNSGRQNVAIDYSEHGQWRFIAGLLLELDKKGINSCTTWRHMGFLFTQKHVCDSGEVPDFSIVASESCKIKDCLLSSGDYGLKEFIKERISPRDIVSFNNNKVIFYEWHDAENNHRWSRGNNPKITFFIDDKEDYKGEIIINASTLGLQNIELILNGKTLLSGQYDLSVDKLHTNFSPALLSHDKNILEFKLPDARKPENGDQRTLALALKSFQIR